MSRNTRTIVIASLFAALACVGTMVIQIPVPGNGYIHLGDCFVLLAGWMLGPLYGGLAAGIGSMLADMLSGYTVYALPTLLIKGAMAVIAGLIAKRSKNVVSLAISAIIAEIVMIVGYFFTAIWLTGSVPTAITTILPNFVQAAGGVVTGVLLWQALSRSGAMRIIKG